MLALLGQLLNPRSLAVVKTALPRVKTSAPHQPWERQGAGLLLFARPLAKRGQEQVALPLQTSAVKP